MTNANSELWFCLWLLKTPIARKSLKFYEMADVRSPFLLRWGRIFSRLNSAIQQFAFLPADGPRSIGYLFTRNLHGYI